MKSNDICVVMKWREQGGIDNESNNDDTSKKGSKGSDLLGHDGCRDDLLDGGFIDDDITSSLGTKNPTALALLDNLLA